MLTGWISGAAANMSRWILSFNGCRELAKHAGNLARRAKSVSVAARFHADGACGGVLGGLFRGLPEQSSWAPPSQVAGSLFVRSMVHAASMPSFLRSGAVTALNERPTRMT
jgi:hypothetical protein